MAFLTDLTQIAMSLVFDLGLNKTSQEPRGAKCFRQASRDKPLYARPKTPSRGVKTMDENRAVLGCFLLSSTYVADFQILSRSAINALSSKGRANDEKNGWTEMDFSA